MTSTFAAASSATSVGRRSKCPSAPRLISSRLAPGVFFRQPAGVRARREVSWAEETDAVNLGGLRVRGRGNEERGGDDGKKAMHLHSITWVARGWRVAR